MIRSSIGELPVALADMPVAEWAAAIVVRHSARTYTGRAVNPALLGRLEYLCDCLPGADSARVVLVRAVPDSLFTGFVGSYGRVTGAASALLMIGSEAKPAAQESAGYLGEAVILEATSLGLGTCWVAGFFDRPLAAALVATAPGERVLAVSPLGEPQTRPRAGERVLKRFVGAHKRRRVEEIAPGFDPERWPSWAAEGVRLARAAPSASNRQPWRFDLESAPTIDAAVAGVTGPSSPTGSVVISTVVRGSEANISRRLDCGIAMLHFEVGARLMGAAGRWEVLQPPAVARYRVTAAAEEPKPEEDQGRRSCRIS
jgi:nitroreductase